MDTLLETLEDVTEAKAVDIIANAEKRNRNFSEVQKFTQPHSSGGISYVLQPRKTGKDSEGNDTYVIDRIHQKEKLEKVLWERNRGHFSQASNTTMAVEPMAGLLNHSGVSEFWDSVLRGEPIPDNLEIP